MRGRGVYTFHGRHHFLVESIFLTHIFDYNCFSEPFLYELKERDLDHGILRSWGELHGSYLQIPRMSAEEPWRALIEPTQLLCQ